MGIAVCQRGVKLAAWALMLVASAGAAAQALPAQWHVTRATPKNYEVTADRDTVHGGKVSVRIAHLSGATDSFGGMVQGASAAPFRGRRIQMTAWVRTEQAESAQLWLRIDSDTEQLAMDNMDDRAVKGTSDWRQVTVVMDVPADATTLAYGFLMQGSGRAWVDDISLGLAGADAKETTLYRLKEMRSFASAPFLPMRTVLAQPANLDFEE